MSRVLRESNIPANFGRCRSYEEMNRDAPKTRDYVVSEIRKLYTQYHLVYAVAYIEDRPRMEHAVWVNAGDPDVASFKFIVHEPSGVIYILVRMSDDLKSI